MNGPKSNLSNEVQTLRMIRSNLKADIKKAEDRIAKSEDEIQNKEGVLMNVEATLARLGFPVDQQGTLDDALEGEGEKPSRRCACCDNLIVGPSWIDAHGLEYCEDCMETEKQLREDNGGATEPEKKTDDKPPDRERPANVDEDGVIQDEGEGMTLAQRGDQIQEEHLRDAFGNYIVREVAKGRPIPVEDFRQEEGEALPYVDGPGDIHGDPELLPPEAREAAERTQRIFHGEDVIEEARRRAREEMEAAESTIPIVKMPGTEYRPHDDREVTVYEPEPGLKITHRRAPRVG